jgi:hypothetical protein
LISSLRKKKINLGRFCINLLLRTNSDEGTTSATSPTAFTPTTFRMIADTTIVLDNTFRTSGLYLDGNKTDKITKVYFVNEPEAVVDNRTRPVPFS